MDYKNEYCAFIDILGFKNILDNFDEALKFYKGFINVVQGAANVHDQMVTQVNKSVGELNKEISVEDTKVEYNIFSDSIILHSNDVFNFFFKVADVVSIIIKMGFLVRGGIGYGPHWSNANGNGHFIVSQALRDAVVIEEKIAKYPRIVLDSKAIDALVASDMDIFRIANLLIQGEDDQWFINPFFFNPDIRPNILMIKDKIIEYRQQTFHDKYLWMGDLCNYFILQRLVREKPNKYYGRDINYAEIGIDEICNTLEYNTNPFLFYYPKFFLVAAPLTFNYSIDKNVYKKTFNENYKDIIRQKSNKRKGEKYNNKF